MPPKKNWCCFNTTNLRLCEKALCVRAAQPWWGGVWAQLRCTVLSLACARALEPVAQSSLGVCARCVEPPSSSSTAPLDGNTTKSDAPALPKSRLPSPTWFARALPSRASCVGTVPRFGGCVNLTCARCPEHERDGLRTTLSRVFQLPSPRNRQSGVPWHVWGFERYRRSASFEEPEVILSRARVGGVKITPVSFFCGFSACVI